VEALEVLKIVLREMTAYGYGWRNDWSNFDGRHLRDQLNDLETWAKQALLSKEPSDFDKGTTFLAEHF